jgi:hypothetical protein
VSHTGATDGFNESFFDDTFLNVERELASALLRRTPAHTVSIGGNVGDLLCLDPLAFFRDRSGTVLGTLGNAAHVFYFVRINEFAHRIMYSFVLIAFRQYFCSPFIIYQNPTKINTRNAVMGLFLKNLRFDEKKSNLAPFLLHI